MAMSDAQNQKAKSKLQRIRKFLATLLAAIYYRVEMDAPISRGDRYQVRFRFHPRKWTIIPTYILFSVFIILIVGITGLVKGIKDSMRVMDYSSYEMWYSNGVEYRNITKWNAYKKF